MDASKTHFGFTNLGSKMHIFRDIVICFSKFWIGSPCTYKVSGFKYDNVPFWDGLRIVGSSAFSRKIITGSSIWEFCWFWSLVELQLQQFLKNLDSWKFAIILHFLVWKPENTKIVIAILRVSNFEMFGFCFPSSNFLPPLFSLHFGKIHCIFILLGDTN